MADVLTQLKQKYQSVLDMSGGAKPIASTQQGSQKYIVKPGDNLSKISQKFYGDAKKYMTIAKANNPGGPR